MLTSVTTANTARIPITTVTTTVWTRATACEPRTFNIVITTTIRAAKILIQAELPHGTASLA